MATLSSTKSILYNKCLDVLVLSLRVLHYRTACGIVTIVTNPEYPQDVSSGP